MFTPPLRRRLTHAQKTKLTLKAKTKKQNFPMRRFAVAASRAILFDFDLSLSGSTIGE